MSHANRAVSSLALEVSMQGPMPNRKDADRALTSRQPWAEGFLAVSSLIIKAALGDQANGTGVPSQNGRQNEPSKIPFIIEISVLRSSDSSGTPSLSALWSLGEQRGLGRARQVGPMCLPSAFPTSCSLT